MAKCRAKINSATHNNTGAIVPQISLILKFPRTRTITKMANARVDVMASSVASSKVAFGDTVLKPAPICKKVIPQDAKSFRTNILI